MSRSTRWTRRSALTVSGVLLALPALAACGTEGHGRAGDGEGATRTVTGAYGEIEIPADPQRIMADPMTVDYLTALGYDTSVIVGVFAATDHVEEEDHYLHDALDWDAMVDPGYTYEADLEQVAAADPDLILVPFDQIDGAEGLDQMKEIAPLLAVPTSEPTEEEGRYGGTASFQDWRGTLRSYGELLDREEEAEAYIAETEEQLETLRTDQAAAIAEIEVVQAKSTPDYVAVNPLTSDKGAIGVTLLRELGFEQPEQLDAIEPDEWGTIDISPENTSLLDGDLLFLEVRDATSRHEDSPLWPTLDVVANDRVVTVGNHWEFGGAVGARAVIADIAAAIDEGVA
ncbi:ABC transporter substrate-binding protein [Nocardioides caeni]|uniref:Fe/B12 periplasmic-binding domain-containing protein n=1 Tax=Nocardioides caeni TaxID=574700 RepID=A0A4S8MZL1_9ACTN|nr:ABC transporter substrate-binding protein [Nocardioides caeni]THV08883.1 hypothetical protein E9934_18585 [Nocardioides caeni]